MLLRRPEPPGRSVSGLALVLTAPEGPEGLPARGARAALPEPADGSRERRSGLSDRRASGANAGVPDGASVGVPDSASDEAPEVAAALGLPLRVDFGVGEAPYDDGTLPLHRGSVGRAGFSDTFLSLEWRSPVTRALALTCRAAFVREQDTALLEGLGDARLGFVVVGCGVSF